jgi:hypothetical protein
VIERTSLSQPIRRAPNEAAADAVSALASHFDVAPDDAKWNAAVSDYRRALADYFEQLQMHMPLWLASVEALAWGDCMPTWQQRQNRSMEEWLRDLPRLRDLVEQARAEWSTIVAEAERRRRDERQGALRDLASAIDEWASSTAPIDADRQSSWLALLSRLHALRREMEDQVLVNGTQLSTAAYPGEVFTRDEATHLMMLLDEYDRAVTSLRLPFEDDPAVMRVSIPESLAEIAGIKTRGREDPRATVAQAIANAESSVSEWPAVKAAVSVWNPSGLLCASLHKVLSPKRFQALAATRIKSTRHSVLTLLEALDVRELLALERLLNVNDTGRDNLPSTKNELFDAVLLALGLLRNAEEPAPQGLDQKIRRHLRCLSRPQQQR